MQGFIDEEYYVYCKNAEEIQEFLIMCQEYGLHFSDRWRVGDDITEMIEENGMLTFVHNWHGCSKPHVDGISCWQWQPDGDGDRPRVNFSDHFADYFARNRIDVSSFLDLL